MINLWFLAIITGGVIVGGLAFYAGKLLKQLQSQKIQQKKAKDEQQRALQTHDKKILNSVVIIVRAMKEEQCDFSEGCWRLSVLLDSLKMSQTLCQEFPAIFELYNQIKELSILDSRKELTKKERMKEDLQRMKAESELHPKIVVDLGLLHQYAIERISVLTT